MIIKKNSGAAICLAAIILLLHGFGLYGVNPDTPIDGYLKTEWRSRNGFVSDTIMNVAQFDDGYLWIGAYMGALRHDGWRSKSISFDAYTPGWGRLVYCFYPDSSGYWLGTSQGLFLFSHGRLKRVEESDNFPVHNMVRFLEKDCYGNLWMGIKDKGLYHVKGGKPDPANSRRILNVGRPGSLSEDRDGNLWLSAGRQGLFKGNVDGFKNIPLLQEEGKKAPYIIVSHVIEDSKGRIWAGTNRGAIMLPGGDPSQQVLYDTGDGLSHNTVWAICEDSDGSLWFGTYSGLSRLKEGRDGQIRFESTLENKRIFSLFEDREKNLWISTYGDGLIRLQDAVFRVYYRDKGVPIGTNVLYRDPGGRIWLGSSMGGLYRMKNGRFEKEIDIRPSFHSMVTGIQADKKGNLWLATLGDGLYYYHINREQMTKASFFDEFEGQYIPVLYMDSDENLWIGTDKGVLRKNSNGVHTYTVQNGVLSKNLTFDVFRDRDKNTWIGTSGGLHFFKGEPGTGNRTIYFKDTGVTVTYEGKDGTIWAGTESYGLRRFKNGKWSEFRVEDGLVFSDILQIKEDGENNLWTTSEHGIMRVDKQILDRFARGEIKRITASSFGFSDGLLSLECCMNPKIAIMETADGQLWFSTNHGIAVVRPEHVTLDKQPPPVIIEEVRFNGKWIEVQDKKQELMGEGQLLLAFTAPVFRSPEKVNFKYRLEGYEDQWHTQNAYGDRTVIYENLTFGKYVFRVMASNASGVWNLDGASFQFELKPFYYQTMIFKVSLLLVIFLSLVAGFLGIKRYLYIRKLKQKYKHSTLDPQKAETYLKKILHFLKVEKIYRDEELSLAAFAEKLAIAPRYLSQIVNEQMNKNFRDFINGYRIEEAKRFLTAKNKSGTPVLEIAFEVGFNSKEAFNRAFKRYTGKTPTEFKKENNGHS